MRTGRQKKKLNILVWIAGFCMIFLPNLISPFYVDASHHNLPKNKCKIICRHRGKHGVCLIYGQDCGGDKVNKTKLYAITPDVPKNSDSKEKDKEKSKKGKNTCHHSDAPQMSKSKGEHMDEDCCPDPDEWANPKCDYSSKDYGILLGHK